MRTAAAKTQLITESSQAPVGASWAAIKPSGIMPIFALAWGKTGTTLAIIAMYENR